MPSEKYRRFYNAILKLARDPKLTYEDIASRLRIPRKIVVAAVAQFRSWGEEGIPDRRRRVMVSGSG